MIGTLVQPNLHAALQHYPLALIIVGVLLEILCVLFWRKSSLRTAGRWMLVIGVLAAVPVITTGLYAMRQTVNPGAPQGELWEAISSTSTWSASQWETLTRHLTYTASGALLLLVGIVVWIGATDNARRQMYLLGIVVLIAGAILVGMGAHSGSTLVYQYGTGVQMQPIAESVPSGELIAPSPAAPAPILPEVQQRISPLELHVFIGGCAIALLAAAIGLSIRMSNVAWENRFAEEKAVAAGYRPAGKLGQDQNLLSIPIIYPGAFWVLSVLTLILAAALGLWVFGVSGPADFFSRIANKQSNDEWRPVLHVYYGVSLVVLAIVLGLVMKFWPRRRVIMGMLCTLLILAVIGQAWTGVLMLFDGQTGSVLRFNRLPANRPVGELPFVPLAPATMPVQDTIEVPDTVPTLGIPEPSAARHTDQPVEEEPIE